MVESKARWKRLIAFMLAFAMVFSSIAVSSLSTVTVQAASSKKVNSVKLKIGSKDVTKKTFSTTLYNEDQKTLKVTVSPKNAVKKITYKSASPKIAYVNRNGVITGKKAGTAKINVTVTGKDKKKTKTWLKVKVKNVKLSLDKKSASVEVGKTTTLKATCSPSKSVKWSTSDKSIATVNNKGVVKGVKAGTATITASRGVIKATCKVTVKGTGIAVESVEASIDSPEISVGGSTQVVANVLPENATDKALSYSSSDEAVATVNPETGVVVGQGEGEATITVSSANGKTATVQVKVIRVNVEKITMASEKLTLGVGESKEVEATVEPENASNKLVSWESENEAIATVDVNGNVTGVAVGNTTIVATAQDGSGVVGRCSVEIVSSDRLTVSLTNPYEENGTVIPDTVLFGKAMNIRVQVIKDNQPLPKANIVLEMVRKLPVSSNTANYRYDLPRNYDTTNDQGYVDFTIPVKNEYSNLNAISKGAQAEIYTFKATEGSTGKSSELTVNTATISTSGIKVVTDGIDTITTGSVGELQQEYVVQRNTSPGGQSTNSVEFTTGTTMTYGMKDDAKRDPEWKVDFTAENTTEGKTGTTSSVYNRSTNETATTTIQDIPKGLQYITMEFGKISLSKFARIDVDLYAVNKTGAPSLLYSDTLTEKNNATNGNFVQIDMEKAGGENYDMRQRRLVVSVITQGRMSVSEEGYVLKSLKGMWKTEQYVDFETHPVAEGSIEWSLVNDVPREQGKLTVGEFTALGGEATTNDEITYTVPAFPYTGDAFITVNGTNTYAYPVISEKNKNTVRPLEGRSLIAITTEEATRIVTPEMTLSENRNNVIVNATETGRTELKATLNINGLDENEFNKQNGKELYTSVQWTPVPSSSSESKAENYYSVEGQVVTVLAQLRDINGDRKTDKGKLITFKVNGSAIDATNTNEQVSLSEVTVDDSFKTPKVVLAAGVKETDNNGQVRLALRGEGLASVKNLQAVCNDYIVDLFIVRSNGNEKIEQGSNIHWVDLGLQFKESAISEGNIEAVDIESYDGKVEIDEPLQSTVGEEWKFGYRPVARIANGNGTTDPVAVDNVSIKYEADSNEIEELSSTTKFSISSGNMGQYLRQDGKVAIVSSKKGLTMGLTGKIDTSDLNNIVFKINGVEKANVGQNASLTLDTCALKVNINWKSKDMNVSLSPVTQSVPQDGNPVINVQVSDEYGNIEQTYESPSCSIVITKPNGEVETAKTLPLAKGKGQIVLRKMLGLTEEDATLEPGYYYVDVDGKGQATVYVSTTEQ